MYDFCFTYPFAVFLAAGGVLGFIMKGSKMSLLGGGGSGAVLYLLAHMSLRRYREGRLWKTGTVLSLIISGELTAFMFMKYNQSKKLFPAGVTMAVCGSMSLFYIFSLFFGPQPVTKRENKK